MIMSLGFDRMANAFGQRYLVGFAICLDLRWSFDSRSRIGNGPDFVMFALETLNPLRRSMTMERSRNTIKEKRTSADFYI